MNSTFILFATELKSHSFLILFFYFWNLRLRGLRYSSNKRNFFYNFDRMKGKSMCFQHSEKIFRNVTCFRFFPFYNANEKTSTFFPHLLSIYHYIS